MKRGLWRRPPAPAAAIDAACASWFVGPTTKFAKVHLGLRPSMGGATATTRVEDGGGGGNVERVVTRCAEGAGSWASSGAPGRMDSVRGLTGENDAGRSTTG